MRRSGIQYIPSDMRTFPLLQEVIIKRLVGSPCPNAVHFSEGRHPTEAHPAASCGNSKMSLHVLVTNQIF